MTSRLFARLFASVLIALMLVTAAKAATFTFNMRNSQYYAVEVELYAQNRRHVWPGGGEVYYLDDGEEKQIYISCQRGEKICYGAWISGDTDTYWGVGKNNSHRCSNCCYTCNGRSSRAINLTD